MSPLTKALVVLVTVLAVLELGMFVAYSAKHTQLTDDLQTAQSELRSAREIARLNQAEVDAAQEKDSETFASLNAQIASLTKDVTTAKAAQAEADRRHQDEKSRSEKTEQAIARLTASAQQDAVLREALIGELKTAREQVVDLRTKVVELSDTVNELTSTNNSLERRIRWGAEELAAAKEKVDVLEKIVARVAPDQMPQAGDVQQAKADGAVRSDVEIKGKVTQVDTTTQTPLVAVNVGTNDGVATGMEFMVHRGDQYVGKLVIENVDADASAGRMVLVRGQVQADDMIYTGPF